MNPIDRSASASEVPTSPPLRVALYAVLPAGSEKAKAALEVFARGRGQIVARYFDQPFRANPTQNAEGAGRATAGRRPMGSDRRPKLRLLLARARTRAFELVVVARFDDLARSRSGVVAILVQLRAAGVRAQSAGGLDIDPDDRPLRWLAAEAERHRKRVRDGIERKRARGERTGQIPFGCALAPDGVKLVAAPEEQAAITAARALRAEGQSWRGVATSLWNLGYTSRAGTAITGRQVERWFRQPQRV